MSDEMIEVTGVDLVKLVQSAYALSRPQGLGMLHYKQGDLSEEDARRIIDRERPDGHIAASMDYVHGRAIKMTVFRRGEKLFIKSAWFDHSASQLRRLLENCGLEDKVSQVEEWSL